ncbi:S8 family serine peptidase [Cytobacillus depressus]|uniref:S8 family serine peptidase n=1 Tax=Cytobacillus depressus TaxID=1602942 RepID=A0A6L3VC30_9BACI|nr:S8 family serine peptidase [Cytobacillus depressus]KAB2336753.1 S8 family serine peptidase [Cytobacillus depressus]
MKKHTLIAFVLFLFLFPFKVDGEELTERVIVTFNEQVDQQIVEKYALDVHYVFANLSAVSMTIADSQKQALLAENKIKRVEDDSKVQTNGQIVDWSYEKVQAQKSKSLGLTGKGVKIGIIDTGVSTSHPDLKVAGGVSFVESSPFYNDDEGHGTHVAGIIAALDNEIGSVGLAPDAEIYAIKTLNSYGEGNQSDVIAGIEWAIQHRMDIVNLSFTAPEGSLLLNEAIRKAYNSGMILVAASGNSVQPLTVGTDVLFPARYPEVIAVGAIGDNNELTAFSYFGKGLEFVAPGMRVYSTYNGYVDGVFREYAYMSGTSMAAPFVTGVAALYKEAYPTLSNHNIRLLMQQSALDLGEPGRDNLYGYGLVQALDTLEKSEVTFPDIAKTAYYKEEIAYLLEHEIITGYPDGRFYPNAAVTRAEAITMIGKALGMAGEIQPTSFSDVPKGNFASGYIRNAADAQIVTGFPDGTFKPKAAIIRGDVAVMLQKAFGYDPGLESAFTDVEAAKYYSPAVNSLKAERITTGYPDGTYKPTINITRADFSVLLARALDESFK